MMEITGLSKLNRYDVKTLTNYNRLVFFETSLKQIRDKVAQEMIYNSSVKKSSRKTELFFI